MPAGCCGPREGGVDSTIACLSAGDGAAVASEENALKRWGQITASQSDGISSVAKGSAATYGIDLRVIRSESMPATTGIIGPMRLRQENAWRGATRDRERTVGRKSGTKASYDSAERSRSNAEAGPLQSDRPGNVAMRSEPAQQQPARFELIMIDG